MKYTREVAQQMYDDCQYFTLGEVVKRYNVYGRSCIRRILTRFGFPSVKEWRRKRYDLTNIQWAYIAGIFDGEGSLTCSRLYIANTFYPLLEFLRSSLGGTIVRMNPHPKSPNHSPCWTWRVSTIPTKSILPYLEPYLIVKKQLVQNFLNT